MTKRSFFAILLVIGGLLGACAKEQAKQEQKKAAPAPEATAWWKTEGQGGSQAAAKLTGQPLPGWSKFANATLASKGKELFSADCASCHTFGKGATAGPDLQGVTHRNTPEWTAKFVAAPETMVKSDPHAKELMTKYLVQMPNFHLKPDEIEAINAYFYQQDLAAVQGK